MRRRWRDLWVLGAAAVGFGAAIAAVAAAAGGTAAAGSSSDRFIAGAHLPPLLTLPGEQVTLRYAIVCSPADPAHDPVGTPCDGGGDVYARGHIRTLAKAVHLDPAPLLAQYDAEHGGRPAPTPAAPLFEAERIRPERRGPNWTAAMVAATRPNVSRPSV